MSEEHDRLADKLTYKRYLFCVYYVKDGNGAKAARDAGYAEKSADVEASRLLSFDSIKAMIAELESDRLKAIKQDSNKIKADIADIKEKCIANGDPANALRASELLGRGVLWEKGGSGIKNISSNPDGTMQISFEDDTDKPTDK